VSFFAAETEKAIQRLLRAARGINKTGATVGDLG